MGVHLDGNLANGRGGVYSFRAQGAIYHKIGGILPSSSERPIFLQLYIYDTDNEINNQVAENPTLNVELVERLRSILDVHNPFVHRFRQLAQEPNIENCQLIIREQPRNRPQYNLPTASEVSTIIVGGEEAGQLNGRDIVVQSNSDHLMNVPDTAGDMSERFQDAMRVVGVSGKPDIFLTMTCNPSWDEIRDLLLPGQLPQDRPDLLSRVFHTKFEEFKDDIFNKGVLGEVVAYAYVIEFQKRGLPHAHMLLIVDDDDKINSPDVYDQIVKVEIPLQSDQPELYTFVLKHMIHGPCGTINPMSPCMQKGKCKRHFSKPFVPYTVQGNDCYPLY
ncbi:uncharacterized protein G2W53_001430 [Senna tora]|uniref:Helitron helicase-like domain-containing protein n=1 Tax=Senna tora TaxID=362788 RepID=A0A834XFI9_9FABA|nr:uncharacterized protein G2W53_001430 [Senna tora]